MRGSRLPPAGFGQRPPTRRSIAGSHSPDQPGTGDHAPGTIRPGNGTVPAIPGNEAENIRSQGRWFFIILLRANPHLSEQYDQAQTALQGAIEAWQGLPQNERVVSYYYYGVGLLALAQGQFAKAQKTCKKPTN